MNSRGKKIGKWKSNKTKEVSVYLEKGANPAVQVDSEVWGRPHMKFTKDDDGDDFEFDSLVFANPAAPFDQPNINPNKDEVSIKNKGDAGKWAYTITVKADGNTYNSDEQGPPGGGRPVIRN